MVIMLKNSLIQCSPVEVSFLHNINFEFVTCVRINIVTWTYVNVIIV